MNPSEPYERAQHLALHEAFVEGRPLDCPTCGGALDRRAVPPRSDVSYVRERLWVSCPLCHRSTVLDRREPR